MKTTLVIAGIVAALTVTASAWAEEKANLVEGVRKFMNGEAVFNEPPFYLQAFLVNKGTFKSRWPFTYTDGYASCVTVANLKSVFFYATEDETGFEITPEPLILLTGKLEAPGYLEPTNDIASLLNTMATLRQEAFQLCGEPYALEKVAK